MEVSLSPRRWARGGIVAFCALAGVTAALFAAQQSQPQVPADWRSLPGQPTIEGQAPVAHRTSPMVAPTRVDRARPRGAAPIIAASADGIDSWTSFRQAAASGTVRNAGSAGGDVQGPASTFNTTVPTVPPGGTTGGVAGPVTVIDFEDLGVAPGGQLNPPDGVGVVTNGFNYTPGPINDAPFNQLYISNAVTFWSYNGTTVGGTNDDVVLSRVDGAPFELQQFDFAGFPTNNEIPFTVENLDTAQVLNYTPDGITDGGPAGAVDFETFVVPAGFIGTQFHFAHWGPGTVQGLFALDNIVVGPAGGDCQTKWSQPLNCDTGCFFSTLNSNANQFVRYDDFVATQTGTIDQVRAWIGDSGDGSGVANISAVEINFYEWIADPNCGFVAGALLCSNTVPVTAANATFVCTNPFGSAIYEFLADLPNPCFQDVDVPYVIRIAGILVDPDGPWMCWQPTSAPFNSAAYSEDIVVGGVLCDANDMAFELLTCPACPAPGSCFEPHPNPGCDDEKCCNLVCAIDPFCCNTSWDQICADEAIELCAGGPCVAARIDFGVTPDDFGNPNDCAVGVTTATTQYVFTQDIVFGTAVDNFNPPAVEIRDDAACNPACRSNGVPAWTGDWWCQFRIGAAPGQPGQIAGVTSFSAELCFINAPAGTVLMEGYNNARALIATASNAGSDDTEVLSIAAPAGDLIAYVRVVSSDPNRLAGLSIDCLSYPDPLPRTPPTDCTVFSNLEAFIIFNESDGKVLKGIENFEPPVSNVPPGAIIALADPLQGGVPNVDGNGVGFPEGLLNLNLIIQSNVLGAAAPMPAPGGGLVAIGPAALDPGPPPVPNSVVVGSAFFADSTDLIFTPEDNHTGVGFDLIDPIGAFNAVITVFNKNNEVIGQFDWPAAPFKTFFGIWCPETIGRINIAGLGQDGSSGGELIDNIYLYREIDKCEWDCGDGNGTVDIVDLLALLAQWNGPGPCDFDGNNVVNIVDLLKLLSAWGPCPCGSAGTGSCFEPNGTPNCDDQDCCNLVCSIDPFCCDTAWDQICADEAIALCVPIDCNDPAACQVSDLVDAYQSNGVTFNGADNFVLASGDQVASLCWRGAYFDFAGDCGPGPDDYRVRYYLDAGGLPGPLLAEYSQAAATLTVSPPVPTGNIIAGIATEYENVGTHAPLFLSAGECYWVEIVNPGPISPCLWFWATSVDGDFYAVQDIGAGGYDPGDVQGFDRSWCLNVPIGGAPPCPQLSPRTAPASGRGGLAPAIRRSDN